MHLFFYVIFIQRMTHTVQELRHHKRHVLLVSANLIIFLMVIQKPIQPQNAHERY